MSTSILKALEHVNALVREGYEVGWSIRKASHLFSVGQDALERAYYSQP